MKKTTGITVSSGLLLGGLLTAVTLAPQPSLATSKSEKLATATANLEAALATTYDNLTDEEQATVYSKRYTAVSDILDEAEDQVNEAKGYVPYVLFANVQEKAIIYAALQDTQAQLLNYEYDVEVINGKYDSTGEGTVNGSDAAVDTDGDGITDTSAVDAANDEMTTLLEEMVAYFQDEDNQSAFSSAMKSVLKEKLDAAYVYSKIGLAALGRAEDAYAAMGQDTTVLATRLDIAQTAYDAGKTYYDTATDALDSGDTETAIKNFNLAARKMVIVYANLLQAEKATNTLESDNQYSPTHNE